MAVFLNTIIITTNSIGIVDTDSRLLLIDSL